MQVVTGSDESLVREAAQRTVDAALGNEDRGLALVEFAGDDYEVAALVDAAQTPPMFSAHRVVVARDLGGRRVDELGDLVRYLEDPLDTTTLVLVWPGSKPAKAVAEALKKAGAETVNADPGFGTKGRQQWLDDAFSLAEVKLDAGAPGGHRQPSRRRHRQASRPSRHAYRRLRTGHPPAAPPTYSLSSARRGPSPRGT